jgi:hypothetical protein
VDVGEHRVVGTLDVVEGSLDADRACIDRLTQSNPGIE